MRILRVVVWTLVGVALAAGVQWAATGASGLGAQLPLWAPPLVTPLAFLLFGVFLVVAYGGAPGAGQGILGTVAALLLVGLPLCYTYGIAQRFGFPGDAGAAGALLAGPFARVAAALWLPVALTSAFRRPRLLVPHGRALPAAPSPFQDARPVDEAEQTPFWSPAPPLQAATESGPVAYTPGGAERT